ncbi:hypothetical protein [uncultured Arthrobacter sp.]|uniref:hypothetical protein n=1 Tax=uncultured Arthrobacter sp. TaxID=114050 RepID=UPI00261C4190|nr:hypothetical protein [uncultured Arthrobacter sp.]
MNTRSTLWFVVAALCVAGAVVVFGGRTTLAEHLGEPLYRTLIIGAYVLLAGAAGSLTRAFLSGDDESDHAAGDIGPHQGL